MKITINLKTDNAAFDNDRESGAHSEVARIVWEVAKRFDTDGPFDGPVFDINGNQVGDVKVSGAFRPRIR